MPRRLGVHSEALELVATVSGADSQNDSASGKLVQGGHLLGDVNGMSQGADEDSGPQLHVPRSRDESRQQCQGLGDLPATQIVMDGEHRVVSQFRGGGNQLHGLLQTSAQRIASRVLMAEKDPELHGHRG